MTLRFDTISFLSDYGLDDEFVGVVKSVVRSLAPDVVVIDITHNIAPHDLRAGGLALARASQYLAPGVVIAVVDPGVGTDRKSVVLKTKTGQYIVTPDNGTLTLVAETLGIAEVREIDEAVNRRKDSQKSYTFHGRDVYAYTGARLAAGVIGMEQVGPLLPKQEVVSIAYQKAVMEGKVIKGTIPVLDVQYGNVWTNIPDELFYQLHLKAGDMLSVKIFHNGKQVYQGDMPYSTTFGAVALGKPLAYLNSLLQLSFALNQGSFAEAHKISSGNEWSVEVAKK